MGLFSAAYQIGAMSEVSEEDALAFLEEFEELIGDIDSVGIFVHNIQISLPMFIPGFGAAWGLFSGWSTGYAFAAIVSQVPALPRPLIRSSFTVVSISLPTAYHCATDGR